MFRTTNFPVELLELPNLFTSITTTKGKFPYHDIYKNTDGSFSIKLTVAGYTEKDLSVYEKDSTLVIEGKVEKEEIAPVIRNITKKSFTERFYIGEDYKVSEVSLQYGILTVKLDPVAEKTKPKTFAIKTT